MNGLLLLGAEGPTTSRAAPALARADRVVAADSGYDLATMFGVEPDLVVGDLDSVQATEALERLPPHRVQRWPADKDHTDAELGVESLLQAGCTEITVVGGGGRRFDHQWGILQLFKRNPMLAEWLTAHERMVTVDDDASFEGWLGGTVSLFALTESVEGLASVGLRWPVNGLALSATVASISNEVIADPFELHLRGGRLLVVRPWPEAVDSNR